MANSAALWNPVALAGRQTVFVPAGAMKARTTNGAGSSTTQSSTNKITLATLDFDQTTQEYAQFYLAFPKSWDLGTLIAEFFWTAGSSSGGVVWGIQAVALSNDDLIDTAFGTAQEVADTLIATTDIHKTAATAAITVAGTPADGDLTIFQVYRKPSDGSDTLAADARLLGVRFTYDTSAINDD